MAINFGGNVLKTHGSLPSITVIWDLLRSLLRYDGSELSDVEIWQPGLLPGVDRMQIGKAPLIFR